MQFEWWIKAVLFGSFDACEHESYQAAKTQTKTWCFGAERLADIVDQAKLNWELSDDGLTRIHSRMDTLLTTSLAILGVVISAMQISQISTLGTSVLTWVGVAFLILASILLLISRLPFSRHTPTELFWSAEDSYTIEDDDVWKFQQATNYYLAQLANDVAARVLRYQIAIALGLIILALLFLAAAALTS